MPRTRRSPQRVRLGVLVGTIIRDGREVRGLTKSALAERVGISRQMVGSVERGDANPSLETIARLLDGTGVDIDLVVRGSVRIGPRRQGDAAHARCSPHVQRRFESEGWLTAREVRIEQGRYVGWIDLLAFHPPTGTLLIIEIKTEIHDFGDIERSMDWYARGAWDAARRLGWRPKRVGSWLLVLATGAAEERIVANRQAIESAFPLRADAMTTLVADPASGVVGRAVALIDPRSHRRDWLVRTRLDGRRSAAQYLDYADFMDRTRGDVGGGPRSRTKNPS